MDKELLRDLHRMSINNHSKNSESSVLGCFNCGIVIGSHQVYEQIEDRELTDLCPNCLIDSLISIDEVLKALNKEYMGYENDLEVIVSKDILSE